MYVSVEIDVFISYATQAHLPDEKKIKILAIKLNAKKALT